MFVSRFGRFDPHLSVRPCYTTVEQGARETGICRYRDRGQNVTSGKWNSWHVPYVVRCTGFFVKIYVGHASGRRATPHTFHYPDPGIVYHTVRWQGAWAETKTTYVWYPTKECCCCSHGGARGQYPARSGMLPLPSGCPCLLRVEDVQVAILLQYAEYCAYACLWLCLQIPYAGIHQTVL